ncbi:hypothetical protein UY3_00306 [Chelonia mydas]|uniref:Myb/SANT-like DNA-binding domain-containing protein n=1 Tax=Chelonia mydas TaxID=8469 RepID=M7BYY1_CHEMY|nr:hypothetical protein UY3_00306 [Chelonia mydas]
MDKGGDVISRVARTHFMRGFESQLSDHELNSVQVDQVNMQKNGVMTLFSMTAWQAAGDRAELISRGDRAELISRGDHDGAKNRKRAPAWTKREVRDLIGVWGEESMLSELRSSFRNAKTFVKISQGMKDRGHNRDLKQCRVKLKELRQAYQKTREANGRSGLLFDSFNGDGGNMEAGFGDGEDDDDEVVDSTQQASGETSFPDSQELFLTLDLEPCQLLDLEPELRVVQSYEHFRITENCHS